MLVIYKAPSFLSLPFLPSFLPFPLLLTSLSSLLPSLAPDNTQSQPDAQTLPVPTFRPTDYDNAAVFLLIGHLDNCDRWLLLQRGYDKQLALTHSATAAPQIVSLLQIEPRNHMLPGYSDVAQNVNILL